MVTVSQLSNVFNKFNCHVKACDKKASTYNKNKGVTYYTCETHDPIKGLVKLYEQGMHKTRKLTK